MREYYYLIAALPMLEFGMKMPFPYSDFLSFCKEQLGASDMDIIKRVSISPDESIDDSSATLREWKRFDRALRNELARFRASRHAKDPVKYIRGEYYPDPFIAGFAQWATSQDSPIETEIALDRARWEKIEELRKGHYFDIDFLITYALKLQILERWQRINSSDGMKTLQELLSTTS